MVPFLLRLLVQSSVVFAVAGYSIRCVPHGHSSLFATINPLSLSNGGNTFGSGISGTEKETQTRWRVNLLFDSECPLCLKEVEFLRKRDALGRCVYVYVCMHACMYAGYLHILHLNVYAVLHGRSVVLGFYVHKDVC
jgi:hypothetical protein